MTNRKFYAGQALPASSASAIEPFGLFAAVLQASKRLGPAYTREAIQSGESSVADTWTPVYSRGFTCGLVVRGGSGGG